MRAVHVSHAGKGQGCRRGHQLARSSGPRRPHPAHTPRRRLARGGTPVTTSVPLAACRTQMQIRWWKREIASRIHTHGCISQHTRSIDHRALSDKIAP